MTRKHRVCIRWIWAALAVSAAICGLLLYWLLRPYSPVTASPFTTDRDTYVAGETVELRNTFCWDGSPFTAERFLIGRVSKVGLGDVAFPWGYAVPEVAERYASGCSPSTIKVTVPSTTPPGDYRISYEVAVKVNPVKVWTTSTASNVFTVTPPES